MNAALSYSLEIKEVKSRGLIPRYSPYCIQLRNASHVLSEKFSTKGKAASVLLKNS